VKLSRETGDWHRVGIALNNLGPAITQALLFEEATTTNLYAVAIFRETGNRHGEARALDGLGWTFREMRRFEEALAAHLNVTAIFCEIGDQYLGDMALNKAERPHAAQGESHQQAPDTCKSNVALPQGLLTHRHQPGRVTTTDMLRQPG
jgi:hypothetical protein